MTPQKPDANRARAVEAALDAAIQRYVEKHPRSRKLAEQARTVLPGGTTRSVLLHAPFPLRVGNAAGSRFEDIVGITYVYLLGNYSAGLFGHAHPLIVEAVTSALRGSANGVHNADEVALGVSLTQRFPTLEQVRYTNSGTEANLMAVATAREFTGRPDVVVFRGGYHGAVMSFPLQPDARTVTMPFPTIVGTYNDVDGAASLIARRADSLACVLVEPMLGASGCLPATAEFMHELRDSTRRASALLIVDEVMTSRNGPNGMQETFGTRGDLMTLGKYIAGGMSFGAFGGRADVMRTFSPENPRSVPHSGTFNNNIASMAAGRVVMDRIYPATVAHAHTARGEELRKKLLRVIERRGAGLTMTGSGSLMNVHGMRSRVTRPDDVLRADDRLKSLLFFLLLEHGYYLAPRGYMAVSLAVTEEEQDGLVAAMDQVIDENPVLRMTGDAGEA
jgi:glutamate-1-semialdehyde 2,1-aminomutase